MFSILIGLGFFSKVAIAYFAFSFYLSLLFVTLRKHYLNKYFWFGLLILGLFTIPFLLWQNANNWYYLDFVKSNEGSSKIYSNVFESLWYLVFSFNIFNYPVWLLGLFSLLFLKNWANYRSLGIMFLIYLLIYLFFEAQFYFLMPLIISFVSIGSVQIEKIIGKKKTLFPEKIIWLLHYRYISRVIFAGGGILCSIIKSGTIHKYDKILKR